MKNIELFFLGIFSAFLALFFQAILFFLFYQSSSLVLALPEFPLSFILISGIMEEIIKTSFIFKKISNFNSQKNIISYAIFLGTGFAATEIVFIYSNIREEIGKYAFEIIGIFLIHILAAAAASFFISRKPQKDWKLFLQASGSAALIHCFYNFLTFR